MNLDLDDEVSNEKNKTNICFFKKIINIVVRTFLECHQNLKNKQTWLQLINKKDINDW